MKKILTTALFFTTILGTVMLTWYFMMPLDSMNIVIEPYRIGNGIVMYKLNLHQYFKNIQNIASLWKTVIPIAPTEPTGDWNAFNGAKMVAKWILFGVNWLIWLLNIIIFTPFRIIMYIIVVFYSFFGLDGTRMMDQLKYLFNFQIPYFDLSVI